MDTTSIYHPELLKGKVFLISGGSNGGLLADMAKGYLRHGAQAVYLMARQIEKLEKVCADLTQFGKAVAVQGDVRQIISCMDVCKKVVDAEGKIDVLVNGAAGNFLASAEKMSSNAFKAVLQIDTVGAFNLSQSAFKNSMKAKGGCIINMSAQMHWNGSACQAHVAAAKAGVDALTKVLATEWGPHGVRVNSLTTGAVKGTEGFERLGNIDNINSKAAFQGYNKSAWETTPKPLGDFVSIPDCTNAALFLSSAAAAYITGETLVVDGGCYLTAPNLMFFQPKFLKNWREGKL